MITTRPSVFWVNRKRIKPFVTEQIVPVNYTREDFKINGEVIVMDVSSLGYYQSTQATILELQANGVRHIAECEITHYVNKYVPHVPNVPNVQTTYRLNMYYMREFHDLAVVHNLLQQGGPAFEELRELSTKDLR